MQQQSRTDNLVVDLVGRLINKLENDGNKQTQQYSTEMQPINNSNGNRGNNSVVNIYNDGTKKEDKNQMKHQPKRQNQHQIQKYQI